MHAFEVHLPTRLLFGPDQGPAFAKHTACLGRHALLVTGGGSAQRLGYADEVTRLLSRAGLRVTFFSGIEPNPDAPTIDRAAAHLRAAGCDCVVALGGGSTLDAAKAIAAVAATPGATEIWPFVFGEPRAGQLRQALPLAAIPTTAATASEVTPYAVISHRAARGKSVLAHECLKPAVAWLNPAFTAQLPPHVTQDGAADILSHVFENYVAGDDASPLADLHAEAILATVLDTLPRVLARPTDLHLRGVLLWASTLALGGLQQAGRRGSGFPLHAIEHALSGLRPELAHGRGLATLFPAYFRWMDLQSRSTSRLARLGRRLFGATGDDRTAAEVFHDGFERWLRENGLRQTLASLGFVPEDYPVAADYAVRVYGDGTSTDAGGPLTREDIVSILQAS